LNLAPAVLTHVGEPLLLGQTVRYRGHPELGLLAALERTRRHVGGIGYDVALEFGSGHHFDTFPRVHINQIVVLHESPGPPHFIPIGFQEPVGGGKVGLKFLEFLLPALARIGPGHQCFQFGFGFFQHAVAQVPELIGIVVQQVLFLEQFIEEFLSQGEVAVGTAQEFVLQV